MNRVERAYRNGNDSSSGRLSFNGSCASIASAVDNHHTCLDAIWLLAFSSRTTLSIGSVQSRPKPSLVDLPESM